MPEATFTCSRCGGIVPVAERQVFDERDFCPACLEEETIVCDHCGVRMWAHQNVGDADIHLCGRCYDRHYTSCEQCGRIIHQDDACYGSDDDYPYCPSCHSEREAEHNGINDYYYKPAPIFYGNGTRYFGVELEIDGAGECGANARQVLSIANTDEEKIYCKHDGSLDDGFEIVTHPMTLDYFVKGDNPLCLIHYPKSGFYLYASTEEILGKALKQMHLACEKPVRVEVSCGDILRIDAAGRITKSTFDTTMLYSWCMPAYHYVQCFHLQ